MEDDGILRELAFFGSGIRAESFTVPPLLASDTTTGTAATFGAVIGTPINRITALRAPLIELARLQVTHGDFTPWNLLWAGDRTVLLDWEEWEPSWRPFWDAFTFQYRRHRLLLGGSPESLWAQLLEPSSEVRVAMSALRAFADCTWQEAWEHFLSTAPHEELGDTSAFRERSLELARSNTSY